MGRLDLLGQLAYSMLRAADCTVISMDTQPDCAGLAMNLVGSGDSSIVFSKSDSSSAPEHLLPRVPGKGTVAIDHTARGQVKGKARQGRDIRRCPRSQKRFHRVAPYRGQQIYAQPIEVAPFACDVAATRLRLGELGPRNPDIVTDCKGEAVAQIEARAMLVFETLAQLLEDGLHLVRQHMQAAIGAAFAHHPWDILRRSQQGSRSFQIATGNQGWSLLRNRGIRNPPLGSRG